MPLPKKTIRVFPNPWGHIHHELGPQTVCAMDFGGRWVPQLRYVGAEHDEERTKNLTPPRERSQLDALGQPTKFDDFEIRFRFPSLEDDLVTPSKECKDGIELPKTPYYLDRLRDGDLVAADEHTAELGARFASLAEAKDAGVATFEAHWGEGTFAEAFPELAGANAKKTAPKASAAAPTAQPSKPADNGGQS